MTCIRRAEAIALSAGALLGAITPVRAQSPALLPIRLGAIPIESTGEAYYGDELGFFKRAGLDASVQSMSNAGALVTAAISGALDVVPTNCVTMAQAYGKGLPLCLVAPGAIYSDKEPTTELAVAVDSPYRTARDLNGKRIGVLTLGGFLQVAVQNWLDRNGGDSKSVTFLELPTPQIVAALNAKRIDAGGLPEPFRSSATKNGEVRIIAAPYSSVGKTLALSAWVANRTWVEANLPTVQRFVAAMRQTADWADKHRSESAVILAKHTRLSAEVIENMRRDPFALKVDAGTIQPIIDVCAKYNLIPRRFPVSDLLVPHLS